MTTPPKAPRYNARRPATPPSAPAISDDAEVASPVQAAAEMTIDTIRAEGLTGRQLRMARRVAQRHGIRATSDFDAVLQLRQAGIDPFQRKNVLGSAGSEASVPVSKASSSDAHLPAAPVPAPQPPAPTPSAPPFNASLEERASEIRKMQRDIARRRRKNLFLMVARLSFFVLLPTILAGIYFFRIATPMYSAESQFVIQQSAPGASAGTGGLGSLFQGTSMATQQDSISVQMYLSSQAAMLRLDEDLGFRAAFTSPDIDALQRLESNSTITQAYGVYKDRIKISYDPSEGLIRLETSAPDPQLAYDFNAALITYAEEHVDQMTKRLRSDQMSGALDVYEKAEAQRADALRELTRLQSEAETLDPVAEGSALMGRIGALEQEGDRLNLELASLLDNPRPNAARVDGVRASIGRIDAQIAQLRSQITEAADGTLSRSQLNAQMREAEENYQVRLVLVQEALAQMESARIEVNRQVRYLSRSVPPTVPDSPSYPLGFENTALAFIGFFAFYLLMSLTAAVLREQLSS